MTAYIQFKIVINRPWLRAYLEFNVVAILVISEVAVESSGLDPGVVRVSIVVQVASVDFFRCLPKNRFVSCGDTKDFLKAPSNGTP